MKWYTKFRLAFRKFFKKYGKIVGIILAIWLVIFLVNLYLKTHKPAVVPSTTYTPHEPVMDQTDEVPKKLQQPINNLIDTYIGYCNNKDYQSAYNMLTNDCKSELYEGKLENFKKYVDEKFDTKKIYTIQNYSNVDSIYIYEVNILNDITATGTTDGYEYYTEKLTIKMEDGELKLSNSNYLKNEKKNVVAEDDYIRVNVLSKDIIYSKEVYNLKITNKTNYYMVLWDNILSDEIVLKIPNEYRRATGLDNGNLILAPNETREISLTFDKFYDDGKESEAINFNAIRLFKEYNWNGPDQNWEEQNAEKIYSFNMSLK